MEVSIQTLEEQKSLTVRTRSSQDKLGEVIGKVYQEIMSYFSELGKEVSGIPYIAYYNMDMNDLDIEIGVTLTEEIPEKGSMKASVIPSGRYVTGTFVGPYETLQEGYNEMTQWMIDNQQNSTGSAYELYMNDPGEVEPKDLITKIMFRLE